MPRKERDRRPQHKALHLHCSYPHCRRSFRSQGGLTKHIRSQHSGQTVSRRSRQRSPLVVHPEPEEVQHFPAAIHANDGSSISNPPDSSVQMPNRSLLPPFFSPQGSLPNSAVGEVPSDSIQRSPGEPLGQAIEPDPSLAESSTSHPLLNGLHSTDFYHLILISF